MARPKSPESDLHNESIRVRLKEADYNLLIALAKKADIPPAVLLRTLIVKQLPTYAAVKDIAARIKPAEYA